MGRMNKLMRNQNLLMRLRKMRTMRMRKMRKKKRKRREMQKTNYKSHESKVFSMKIPRVLPPVILIIGIMISEYYQICSLLNQNSDLVIADINKAPLIFIFVCLCECFSCKLFV